MLFSDEISRILGIECCALSGANLASEVAEEKYGESTIGTKNIETDGKIFHKVNSGIENICSCEWLFFSVG